MLFVIPFTKKIVSPQKHTVYAFFFVIHPTVGRKVVEKRKTAPPAGNLDSGSPLFQPLARMSCHHPAKTSHINSLNISAADYLR